MISDKLNQNSFFYVTACYTNFSVSWNIHEHKFKQNTTDNKHVRQRPSFTWQGQRKGRQTRDLFAVVHGESI